jgi:pimeloyl-ACP methyl ester carboxylesterase
MAETPETHYVKSDDVHIAYQVLGDGPFDLLFVPGFVSNVEALWRSPDQSAFFRRLASFSRLILFDKRGTGMSDRTAHDFTLEQRMHDVQAILDAIGCKQAALFGVSEGGPMSLLYAATYPQRTSALVLYGSYAKRSLAPDYPFGWDDQQWQRVLDDIDLKWGSPQSLAIGMRTAGSGDDALRAERVAAYYRAAASPGAAAAIMRMNRDIDVRHILSATHVPTLVLHRTGDPVIEVGHARYLAQHIPGAKLVELDEPLHTPWLGNRDAILDVVERFLTGAQHIREPERLLATVLFADIVGSTERVAAIGDSPWRELLNEFHAQVREVLQFYRGREVSTAGDGFLAAFDGRLEPSAVPARSGTLYGLLASNCAVAFTPANANSSVAILLVLPSISVREWPRSRPRARFWSHKPSVILSRVRAWRSRTGGRIGSREYQTSGACSAPSRISPFGNHPASDSHRTSLIVIVIVVRPRRGIIVGLWPAVVIRRRRAVVVGLRCRRALGGRCVTILRHRLRRRAAGKYRPAALRQIRPVRPQAGDDPADIGDLRRAEPPHIGRAGHLLLGRPAILDRQRGINCGNAAADNEHNTERQSLCPHHRFLSVPRAE